MRCKAGRPYKDYLRARNLQMWDKDSKEAQYVRRLGRKTPQTIGLYRQFVETRPPEVIANMAICLIHQANYLIDRQLLRLEQEFLKQGGLRERMTRARLAVRSDPHPSPPSHSSHSSPPSHSSHDSHDSHPRSLGQ
jgi:four helix bundle suffix protein